MQKNFFMLAKNEQKEWGAVSLQVIVDLTMLTVANSMRQWELLREKDIKRPTGIIWMIGGY